MPITTRMVSEARIHEFVAACENFSIPRDAIVARLEGRGDIHAFFWPSGFDDVYMLIDRTITNPPLGSPTATESMLIDSMRIGGVMPPSMPSPTPSAPPTEAPSYWPIFSSEIMLSDRQYIIRFMCRACSLYKDIFFRTGNTLQVIRKTINSYRPIMCENCQCTGHEVFQASEAMWERNGELVVELRRGVLDWIMTGLRENSLGPFCNRCGVSKATLSDSKQKPLVVYKYRGGEEHLLCEECIVHVRRDEYIKSHGFNPQRFKFTHGDKERSMLKAPIYYGTELEINTEGEPGYHAMRFEKWLKSHSMDRYFYFKRDGSISQGYEIVTHPMTAKARHELIDWKAICQYLRDTKASSEESGECGLHIHASRDLLSNRDIAKMKYFFYSNRHSIHKLSRRVNYRYCQIEEFSVRDKRLLSGWKKSNFLNTIPDSGNRYSAVNLHTGKSTVEFRVMRGTLDHKRLIASFQMVDALIHFAKLHSLLSQDTAYSWVTFKKWLRDANQYNHLESYLTKEGI